MEEFLADIDFGRYWQGDKKLSYGGYGYTGPEDMWSLLFKDGLLHKIRFYAHLWT